MPGECLGCQVRRVSGFSRTGVQMRFTPLRAFVVAVTAAATVGVHSAGAQSAPDRAKLLRAAADALGMVRWSDIGAGTARLPAIDVVNTMELQGSGTIEGCWRVGKVQYTRTLATIRRPCA